jgi:hypothetical protein
MLSYRVQARLVRHHTVVNVHVVMIPAGQQLDRAQEKWAHGVIEFASSRSHYLFLRRVAATVDFRAKYLAFFGRRCNRGVLVS